MKPTDIKHNPWAGLSSYEDPAKSELKLKFCGRDSETYDVTRLIDDNFFVTLYGKSGIGKTSLLNAGVFPALRRKQYTPLSLRLGMMDETQTFQDIITTAIERTVTEWGGSVKVIPVVDEQTEQNAADYLWNWFARRQFMNTKGQTTFPVIVLDQFEEVFRTEKSRKKTEELLAQLHYLIDESHALNDCIVNGEEYYYDFNFRFVLSIREDDLYRLEDSIDNGALTALKRCRYRLRNLSEKNAETAILIPGAGLFNEEEKESIVKSILNKSRNEDGSISTNIVSLLCSRIFVDFQRRKDADQISLSMVDGFIKGNPFERFYNEATKGCSNREKSYIEDHLVDSTGRRNSIPESDFLLHVKNGAKLLEGDTRILQRTSTSSDGGNYRIELIHDSFCEPLAGLKEKREKKKRIMWFASAVAIVLLCGGIVSLIMSQANLIMSQANRNQSLEGTVSKQELQLQQQVNELEAKNVELEAEKKASEKKSQQLAVALEEAKRANQTKEQAILALQWKNKELEEEQRRTFEANWKKNENESKVLSYKAEQLIEEDSYLASRIALAALPEDLSHPDRPVIPEAEALLRRASTSHKTILQGHFGSVKSAAFSPDGKYIVTASGDHTAIVWNAENGEAIDTLKHRGDWVYSAAFSPDGKYIVTATSNAAIVWNTENGEKITSLRHIHNRYQQSVNSAAFSPDGKYIVTASDETSIVWNAESGEAIDTLKHRRDRVKSAAFSPDGKYIVTATNYAAIVWNAENGETIDTLIFKGLSGYVNSAAFSPDGKYIVTAKGHTAIVCYSENGEIITTLKGHKDEVRSAAFSPDGKYIVTASSDMTARIWDIQQLYHQPTISGDIVHVENGTEKGKFLVTENGIHNIYMKDVVDSTSTIYYSGNIGNFAYSPDFKHIIASSAKHDIIEWDVSSGDITKQFHGHTNQIYHLAYSPDGKQIISASADSTIRIWNTDGETVSHIFQKLDDEVNYAAFSPDGEKIIANTRKNILIWDRNQKEITKIKHELNIFAASSSSDGRYLAATHKDSVLVWNAANGDMVANFIDKKDVYYRNPIFSPDGMHIMCTFFTNDIPSGLTIWDIRSRKVVKSFTFEDSYTSAAYNSDGTMLTVGTLNGDSIIIWDTRTWEKIDRIIYKGDGVLYVTFSPDLDGRYIIATFFSGFRTYLYMIDRQREEKDKNFSNYIHHAASLSPDGKYMVSPFSNVNAALLWNVETGEPIDTLKGHRVYSAAFSPDGKYIVTASSEKTAIVWNTEKGEAIDTLIGHKDWVRSAVFSPDGKYIVTASRDETAIVWNTENGEAIDTLIGHKDFVNSAVFSPDGKYIVTASSDKTAIVWNAESGEAIDTLIGHKDNVNSASFSPPDGKYIVTASKDHTAIVWNAENGQIIQTFKSPYATHAFWTSDGESIVTWSEKGLRIWDFPPLQKLIDDTRERFKNRPLTPEEKRNYYLE